MRDDDYRDVPLTLAVALGSWALAVTAAAGEGVLARLPAPVIAAVAAFATAFAAGVVLLDVRVRAWLDARGRAVPLAALAAWSSLAAAAGAVAEGLDAARLATLPWATLVLVGAPVAAACTIVAARSALAMRWAVPVPKSGVS